MIASAWNNGFHWINKAEYGFQINRSDWDSYFKRKG